MFTFSATVTNLTKPALIFHEFPGATIKFHDLSGLEMKFFNFMTFQVSHDPYDPSNAH